MKDFIFLCVGIFIVFSIGCASNDHLLFFTNSTIGIEISSDPAAGAPAKFIVGYKRSEGVIDPLIPEYELLHSTEANRNQASPPSDQDISITSESTHQYGDTRVISTPMGIIAPKGNDTKPHSVIAKIDFGALGGGSSASAAQWFATGKAAELVAEADGISSALSGAIEPTPSKSLELDKTPGDLSVSAHLVSIYLILKDTVESGSTEARSVQDNVNNMAAKIFKEPFNTYKIDDSKKSFTKEAVPANGNMDFSQAINYLYEIKRSKENAITILSEKDIKHNNAELSKDMKKSIIDDIFIMSTKIESAELTISKSKELIDMINFVAETALFKAE